MKIKLAFLFIFAVLSFQGIGMISICNQLRNMLGSAERNLDIAYQHNDTIAIYQFSYLCNGYAIGLAQEGCI